MPFIKFLMGKQILKSNEYTHVKTGHSAEKQLMRAGLKRHWNHGQAGSPPLMFLLKMAVYLGF